MGAECVSVNKHHSTSKIKDKYTEFRNKFYHIWSENPIYKFLQQDIDLIDRSQQDLVLKGPEFFNLENFINSMPKVDDFNKNIFNHLNKLYYKQLEEVLQGSFPDVGQFFLNVVIFLLSNPNMSPKKANLAESFINCYLIRPKKPKKKKGKGEESKKELVNPTEGQQVQPDGTRGTNGTTQQPQPQEPEAPLKKRLNLTVIHDICLFLVNFCRQIMIYFILNFVYILDSSKSVDMFNFDTQVLDANGNLVMYELEYTFFANFKLVNREFNKDNFNNMWTNFLLLPFEKRIFIF